MGQGLFQIVGLRGGALGVEPQRSEDTVGARGGCGFGSLLLGCWWIMRGGGRVGVGVVGVSGWCGGGSTDELGAEMERKNLRGAAVTLKVKTDQFDVRTRDTWSPANERSKWWPPLYVSSRAAPIYYLYYS